MRRGTSLELDGDPRLLDALCSDGAVVRAPHLEDGLGLLTTDGAAPFLASSLELTPAVELVQIIVARQLTGALDVRTPRGSRRLFFEHGAYSGSRSRVPEDTFGQVLWRAGRLSLDQVVIAVENAKASNMRIGAALVSLGYLLKPEVRAFLLQQAEAVFDAACTASEGLAVFRPGVSTTNPVRFFDRTHGLLLRAREHANRCVALREMLDPLDRPVKAGPPGQGPVGEAETALLQLTTAAKGARITLRDLLHKSDLGELTGLRALGSLIDERVLVLGDPPKEDDAASRLARLCAAVSETLKILDEKGFGLGDEVRSFASAPPAGTPDALRDVDLSGAVTADAALAQARRADAALRPDDLERALLALLDYALFQARETLDEETAEELADEVARLKLFG